MAQKMTFWIQYGYYDAYLCNIQEGIRSGTSTLINSWFDLDSSWNQSTSTLSHHHGLPILLDCSALQKIVVAVQYTEKKSCIIFTMSTWPGCIHFPKKLSAGTVPANMEHLTGIVPVNKEHLTGTLYIFWGNGEEMLTNMSAYPAYPNWFCRWQ